MIQNSENQKGETHTLRGGNDSIPPLVLWDLGGHRQLDLVGVVFESPFPPSAAYEPVKLQPPIQESNWVIYMQPFCTQKLL